MCHFRRVSARNCRTVGTVRRWERTLKRLVASTSQPVGPLPTCTPPALPLSLSQVHCAEKMQMTHLVHRLAPDLLLTIFVAGTRSQYEPAEDEELGELEVNEAQTWRRANSELGSRPPNFRNPESENALRFLRLSAALDDSDDNGFIPHSHSTDRNAPKRPFQLNVSHVCRRWREIATSFTAAVLWTHIELSYRVPYHLSRLFIKRSGTLPLYIIFNSPAPKVGEEENAEARSNRLSRALEVVIPHVSRWRSFASVCSGADDMSLLVTALYKVSSAPLLRSIKLHDYGEIDEGLESAAKQLLFSGYMPDLEEVDISGTYTSLEILLPDAKRKLPSWSGLTTLSLRDIRDNLPSFSSFASMIRGSPQLQSLSLAHAGPEGVVMDNELVEPGDWPSADDSPLFLRSLARLRLEYKSPAYVTALVRYFQIPALRTLSLCLTRNQKLKNASHFDEFLGQLRAPVGWVRTIKKEESPSPTMPSSPKPPETPQGNCERVGAKKEECSPVSLRAPSSPHSDASEEDPPSDLPPTILSSVTELILEALECSDNALPAFFEALPRLRTLSFDQRFCTPDPLEFCTSWTCRLKKLILTPGPQSSEQISERPGGSDLGIYICENADIDHLILRQEPRFASNYDWIALKVDRFEYYSTALKREP